jgi:hypothetical protein
MSSSTRPSSSGSRSAIRAHAGEDALPRPRDVGLAARRPTESGAHTCFHGRPRGTIGHCASPSRAGLTACQTSTYGCPHPRERAPGAAHSSRRRRCGTPSSPSPCDRRGRRGVDPEPAPKSATTRDRSSSPSRYSTTTPSTRRSSPRRARPARRRGAPRHRCARARDSGTVFAAGTEPEAVRVGVAGPWRTGACRITGGPPAGSRPEGEGAPLPATVLQLDGVQVAVHSDDGPTPAGHDLFDHHVLGGGDRFGVPALGRLPVTTG